MCYIYESESRKMLINKCSFKLICIYFPVVSAGSFNIHIYIYHKQTRNHIYASLNLICNIKIMHFGKSMYFNE